MDGGDEGMDGGVEGMSSGIDAPSLKYCNISIVNGDSSAVSPGTLLG